ncbi:DUF1365 domain-containing protein [Vibrio rarus]|uniref:DUF1365 domain-containing protein n=1 Tax=Vibrio rarus TaxID=413403 RepID=UPI0021C32CC5|nr:DUF1365 family protein [Vibrio rarus]
MKSALMLGEVRHRRFTPVKHDLNYPIFMPCIDLDEMETLQQTVWGFGQRWWHWARFRRADYVGEGCLKSAVQRKVLQLTGESYSGKVLAVVHLRYLGLYFSPVNFYYVYDDKGQWRTLLAEVSNTPWNERHYYAISAQPGINSENWQHEKQFHVSPFNPLQQQYVWKLKPLSRRLLVHLECHRQTKEFDATLMMKGYPFTSKNLIKQLISTPIMAVKMIVGIYWHALKLWLKKVPLYAHPAKHK